MILDLNRDPDIDPDRLRCEGKRTTPPKPLTEPKSARGLGHLPVDWPDRLYDDAIIAHVLKVIGNPQRPEGRRATGSRLPRSQQFGRDPLRREAALAHPFSLPASAPQESKSDQGKRLA
jgi:hypothetical protein